MVRLVYIVTRTGIIAIAEENKYKILIVSRGKPLLFCYKKGGPTIKTMQRKKAVKLFYGIILIQVMSLLICAELIYLFNLLPITMPKEWLHLGEPFYVFGWGTGVAIGFVVLLTILYRIVPKKWLVDDGTNDCLHKELYSYELAVLFFIVAVGEELLFRGTLQFIMGNVLSSVLFVLAHIRYLKKWLLTTCLFLFSLSLGYLYEISGTIWAVIWCHYLFNMILSHIGKISSRLNS